METTNTRTDVAGSVAGAVGNLDTNYTSNRVTAIFDSRAHAEMAVNELRQLGIGDSHLSVIARHEDNGYSRSVIEDHDDGADVAKGTLAGAGVGALFGIAAALIPGVGPFITAGALLSTALGAVGGGAVAGAVVGGTTGLIASALAKAGYSEEEAHHYGESIESGGTLVVVDTLYNSPEQVREVLTRHGGRTTL